MNDSEDSRLPPPLAMAIEEEDAEFLEKTAVRKSVAPASTLSPRQLVAERFEIIGLLGRGTMGEVYEAEDLLLQERVALKVLRPELEGEPAAVERFLQEIRLARRINHPNVCRLFETGGDRVEEPGSPPRERHFFTMELLDGETLGQRLQRRGRQTTAQTLPLVRQMTEALGAAHAAGVVHRDFKSENVLLVRAPSGGGIRVVVMDFGLARNLRGGPWNPTSTDFVGTPAYMAPEQVEGDDVTPAADVYALGVVMYEMLTGLLPFSGDHPLTVARRRLAEAPLPPSRHVPDLDPDWEAVILKCLARDPAQRFPNGTAVRDVLPVPKPVPEIRQGARAPLESGQADPHAVTN